jgi:hypothetical protein
VPLQFGRARPARDEALPFAPCDALSAAYEGGLPIAQWPYLELNGTRRGPLQDCSVQRRRLRTVELRTRELGSLKVCSMRLLAAHSKETSRGGAIHWQKEGHRAASSHTPPGHQQRAHANIDRWRCWEQIMVVRIEEVGAGMPLQRRINQPPRQCSRHCPASRREKSPSPKVRQAVRLHKHGDPKSRQSNTVGSLRSGCLKCSLTPKDCSVAVRAPAKLVCRVCPVCLHCTCQNTVPPVIVVGDRVRNMATKTNDPEAAAQGTLALLQSRLHRLEFLVSGVSDDAGIPPPTPSPISGSETLRVRLDALEAGLAKLKRLSGTPGTVARDVDRLCELKGWTDCMGHSY